jgi:hypothetical protein
VATQIIGRTVHTGGPALWYAEASAWCDGPNAWQEFNCQVTEDIIELHQTLAQDVIRFPWRNNIRPTARKDETTFICGDEYGNQQIWRWDANSMNFIRTGYQAKLRVENWQEIARLSEKTLKERIAHVSETAGVPECQLQERLDEAMMVVANSAGLSLGVTEEQLIAALVEPSAVEDILDCDLAISLAHIEAIASRGIKVILGGRYW